MKDFAISDLLFYLCCSNKNQKPILKKIKLKKIKKKIKFKEEPQIVSVLCNKTIIDNKVRFLKGKRVKLITVN